MMKHRTMRFTPAAAALIAICGSAAGAQTADGEWGGTYFGAQLGWGWTDGDGTFQLGDTGYDGDFDGSGANYGLTLGYRYDLGTLVLGGEAQFDWSDTKFEDVSLDGLSGDVDDAGRLKDMWRVVGLVGYDAGRTLVYGTAGWARASLETDHDLFDGEGWVVGGGVDYQINDQVTVGGQLNYHSFDDIGTGVESLDFSTTRAQARVMFRF